MNEILTPRLRIRPFGVVDLEAAVAGDTVLAEHLGANVVEGWMEFPEALPYWRDHLRLHPESTPWAMYGYFERDGGRLVGGGGFKGGPTPDGTVEIGYGIAPAYRARGLATEAAAALTAFAFGHRAVALVVAHTMPEPNASSRVLERCGFTFDGELLDIDDGPVWRWRVARTSPIGADAQPGPRP